MYYGMTQKKLTIYDNYALGWDLVYFLRTTKKPEYQGILDRYFSTLAEASQGLTAAMLDQTDQMGPVAMRAGRTHTLAVDRLALHDLAVRADDATGIRRCGGQTGDQMRHLLFKNIGIDLA